MLTHGVLRGGTLPRQTSAYLTLSLVDGSSTRSGSKWRGSGLAPGLPCGLVPAFTLLGLMPEHGGIPVWMAMRPVDGLLQPCAWGASSSPAPV